MNRLVEIFKKDYLVIPLVIVFNLLTIFYIKDAIPLPIHYLIRNIFVFDLLGKEVFLSFEVILLFQIANIILLWLIGKAIFAKGYPVLPAMIYAIVPWSAYLVFAQSFYIFLLTLVLLIILGLTLIVQKRFGLGNGLLIIGSLGAVYSSLVMLFLVPIFLVLIIALKIVKFSQIKRALVVVFVLMLPLVFLVVQNKGSYENVLFKQVKIFYDPGLLNTVNSYQGAALEEGLTPLAKVSENKYLYSAEFTLSKYIKSLLPATYFTAQEKLLEFSFTPPIYLGFLIPFLYGIYKLIQNSLMRKLFLVSTLLVFPSVLWKLPVDLNRLVLFSPIIVLIITAGFNYMYSIRKVNVTKFLWILTLFLILFQTGMVFFDVQNKELIRFSRYLGDRYEIDK